MSGHVKVLACILVLKVMISLLIIVGFFIPVSSLKVFGHPIHSERRRIYPGKSIQALQNDTLSYHGYSVSESSSQGAVAYFKNFCVCLTFSSFLFHYKTFTSI